MLCYSIRESYASRQTGLRLKTSFSILSTPLMALKKRGFNVDRMLNQQREEKLRLQAETMRDRERAISERSNEVNGDDDLDEPSVQDQLIRSISQVSRNLRDRDWKLMERLGITEVWDKKVFFRQAEE